jgi:ribosomal protein S18 acetylase RimI-like enzyme
MFDYKINPLLKAEQVEMVFRNSEVDVTTYDLERIQKTIDNAGIIVTAWYGDTLVGIARSITDSTYCCYLSELAVVKEYQKQGIGTELVRKLREYLGEGVAIILI